MDALKTQESAARALSKQKQDAFCKQLDSHLAAIQKVSKMKTSKMEAQLQAQKSMAKHMITKGVAKSKKALITAEQDLAVKTVKLKVLSAKNLNAEAALSKLQGELKRKLEKVKAQAAKLVMGPQNDMLKLFSHAKMGMKKMKKEMKKQEQQVQTVARMYENEQQVKELVMERASEVMGLAKEAGD